MEEAAIVKHDDRTGRRISWIAYVLHPAFLYFYATVIYILLEDSTVTTFYFVSRVIAYTFSLTVLFPVIFIRMNYPDMLLKERKNRIIPLFVSAASYFGCKLLITLLPLSPVLKAYLSASILGMMLLGLISIRFKISLHASGYTSFGIFLPLIIAYQGYYAWPAFLLCLLMGTGLIYQRLSSGAHTLSEVLAGISLGICSGLLYGWKFII